MHFCQQNNHELTSLTGKIGASLFFLVFAGFGLGFMLLMGNSLLREWKSGDWEKSTATITEAKQNSGEGKNHTLALRYEYRYKGGKYFGERYSISNNHLTGSYKEVEQAREKFAVGSSHEVFINPQNPQDAILERKTSYSQIPFLLLPLIFCVIGIGGLAFTWWRKKENPAGNHTPPPSPLTNARKKSHQHLSLLVFMSLFLLAGLAFLTFMFVIPAKKTLEARSWQKTPCVIVSSRVVTHSDSDGSTYAVEVVYRYTFKGRNYTGDKYDFVTGSSSGYDAKSAIVRQYPAGKQTFCYIDPANPEEAVISTEFRGDYLFALIPLLFVVVGACGIVYAIKSWWKGRRPDAGGLAAVEDATDYSGGSRELKPRTTPVKSFFGLLFFALFWNGLVSVFVTIAVKGWMKGSPEWFLSFFLIPFVLIGFTVLILAFFAAMDMFSPRPRLELNPSALRLGEEATASWQIPGARAYKQLSIYVEGIQKIRTESKNSKGENNIQTESETFMFFPLLQTDIEQEMAAGSKKFRIPANLMHTFSAPNHKICWQIVIDGKRRFRPALRCEYEINVRPRAKGEDHHVMG